MRVTCQFLKIIFTLVLICGLVLPASSALAAPRPPIVGIAHIAFEVSDLAKARTFYGKLLGYEEPFQVNKDDGSLLLTYFKVNERQYI